MHNIILIEKESQESPFWPNLVKYNKTKLSVEEVVKKYNGFEGDLLLYAIFDSNHLEYLIKCYDELSESSNCMILHILTDSSIMPEFLKDKTKKVGYDVGVCDEEKTIYSSIFNEILFGYFQELIDFNVYLNENLLFPNRNLGEEYVNLHDKLSAQNKGVEDYEEMNIYEIWKHL